MSINWEYLGTDRAQQGREPVPKEWQPEVATYRAKLPGGWLVMTIVANNHPPCLTFYPDPNHRWDGSSVR